MSGHSGGSGLRRFFVVPEEDGAAVRPAPPVPLRSIFRRFWPFTRGSRRWLLVTLLFILAAPVVEAVEIWLFKVVVDEVLIPRDFGRFLPIAGVYLGLTLVGGLLSFGDDVLSSWVSERFLLRLRSHVFRHVQGLSFDFFERRQLGDLISRLTGDVAAIESFLLSGVADALSYAVRLLVFAGALFYLDAELAALSLVVVPLFWLLARRFSRLVKAASREKRRRSGSISAVAEEGLANIALVQAYNRQEWELGRFHAENLGKYGAEMAATRLRALFTPLVDVVELLGGLLVIGLGTFQLSRGELTLGGLLVFLTYLARLYSPIRGLSRLTTALYSASAGAERVIELLDERPRVREPLLPQRPGRVRGAIEVRGVSFAYPGTARPALSDVSLQVRPGETLAVVGPSGAGKSTLIKLLLRFYDPDSGTVCLDGVDLRRLSLTDLRDNVAVVLQETLVFDGTVRDNIAYGRPGATDAQVVAAAREADAAEFIRRLPEGYDTVIGQRGRLLSGGQRQRIAIARAMIRDAPVLLLDEPATGLDAATGARVLEPMRRLMSGRTTVVISHNLLSVRFADSIVVLDQGRVVERGDHAGLAAAGGTYARLHDLHVARPERAGALS